MHAPVLIAGCGPVGATLALDLAWRGVPCVVLEQSTENPTNPRCNTTGARSMEHFRRLGIAATIREAGLPDSYPTDVAYRTHLTGPEILRFSLPSASGVLSKQWRDDDLWPTPEPQHRIAQIFLEPILRKALAPYPHVQFMQGKALVSFEQDEDKVAAIVEDSRTGEREEITANYLVGCDGSRSTVRKGLGIKLEGVAKMHQALSFFYRSRDMHRIIDRKTWMSFSYNEKGLGNIVAIDGDELWLNHNFFPADHDVSQEDPKALLFNTLGAEIEFEELGVVTWTTRRLVAERYRDGRAFVCGDAAHLWIPMAGFGMNAGIQDATHLAWILSARLKGWGGDELLDAYELERRPVGEQIGRAAQAIGVNLFGLDRTGLEEPGDEGVRRRAELARQIEAADQRQFNPVGFNFGYHYADSPFVWFERDPLPLEVDVYEPVALPGCRLPHYWRGENHSVFDDLGKDFTLLRVGANAPSGDALVASAARAGMPLKLLDLPEPEASRLYERKLLLVRPDQHVAWRGDALPDDVDALLDIARGVARRVQPKQVEAAQ